MCTIDVTNRDTVFCTLMFIKGKTEELILSVVQSQNTTKYDSH